MGILDIFSQQSQVPTVNSILPDVAKQEIMNGRLPILNNDKIFMRSGEHCHFIDKAIYEKKKVNKRYVRRGNGYSMPGIFKGTRIHMRGGHTDVVDNIQYETIRGVLYITNQRIIFVAESDGFDKKISDLIALTPYSNCVELQFSKQIYKLFVPDGNVAQMVLRLIKP
ncbi:hypothetical protein [uncultured Ruminococcus sp.]|uniref:hypothetical protein n=1 Tax=uncultured Ruminococcus sp. TaxID=165186 RepID=UPI0025E632FA|nr:hypothetical protein [uncultured Ruminococcus sp.]